MSSRRQLKKRINKAMDLLYTDCVFYKVFVINADKEAADKVITHITESQNDLLKRISSTEGKNRKDRVKAYYNKLNKDFQSQINLLGDEITALG